jgi:hypothetical protein
MTDPQLKRLQRLVEKWEKHLPTCADTNFTGSTGVMKGQRYAYKRVLRQIEAILREVDVSHDNGELRTVQTVRR